MGAARSPAHPLLLDESLSHELIGRRCYKPGGDALPAPKPLAAVDDSASVVINISCEFLQGAGQLFRCHRDRSSSLAIFLYRAANFKNQARQRLVSTEHITMAQEYIIRSGVMSHISSVRTLIEQIHLVR
jgi:hypothetical protein